MFSTKTSEGRQCVKYGNFIQSPKAEMFRKFTGNGVSTEYVLTWRLSKNSVFYAVRSAKVS